MATAGSQEVAMTEVLRFGFSNTPLQLDTSVSTDPTQSPFVQATTLQPEQLAQAVMLEPSTSGITFAPLAATPQPMAPEETNGVNRRGGLPNSGTRANQITREAFVQANAGDPIADRGVFANARFFAPAAGQSWTDIVRQAYGGELPQGISETQLRMLGEALAQLNGRSNLEAMPTAVAAPDLAELASVLQAMRRDLSNSTGRPIMRAAVARLGGENVTPRVLPTPGNSYRTQWNDTLRGVALYAYRQTLQGLPPEQADAKLRLMMLALANLNELNNTNLQDAGLIWVPTAEQMNRLVTELEGGQLAGLQGSHPELWEAIQRTGRNASTDLQFLQNRQIAPATSPSDLGSLIESTSALVDAARANRVMSSSDSSNVFGMNLGWLAELFREEPPAVGEIPIRRDNEDLAAYIDRVAPNLSAEDKRRMMEHPQNFMLRSAGIMNSNGDIDQTKMAEFTRTMQSLGLMDQNGTWNVTPSANQTLEQAADQRTIAAMQRLGLNLQANQGESLEQVVAKANEAANPQQQQLIRQLVIWNQMVTLGSGQNAATPGAPQATGMQAQSTGSMQTVLQDFGYWPGGSAVGGGPKSTYSHLTLEQMIQIMGDAPAPVTPSASATESRSRNAEAETRNSPLYNTLQMAEKQRAAALASMPGEDTRNERRRDAERNLRQETETHRQVNEALDTAAEQRVALNDQLAEGEVPGGAPPPRDGRRFS
jgi:hypothetical protein